MGPPLLASKIRAVWPLGGVRRMEEAWVLEGHENPEFGLGLAKFETHLGHPFGTLEGAVGSAMLGLGGGQCCRFSVEIDHHTEAKSQDSRCDQQSREAVSAKKRRGLVPEGLP